MQKNILLCIALLSIVTPIFIRSACMDSLPHRSSLIYSEPDKKLLAAACFGGKMQAKKALENGASINRIDHEYCFAVPLMIAVDSLHVQMVNYLLRKGAAINSTDFFGNTVLHLLAEKDFREYPKKDILQIAKILIKAGANPSEQNHSGLTPLKIAKLNRKNFDYDNTRLIGVLSRASQKGKKPSKKQKKLNRALNSAALVGDRKKAHELLQAKADVNGVVSCLQHTPLLAATEWAKPEMVMDLLQAKADINARDHVGRTAVHMIVDKPSRLYPQEPNIAILKALIEANADLTIKYANDWTPLELAKFNLSLGEYDDPALVDILQAASGEQKESGERKREAC